MFRVHLFSLSLSSRRPRSRARELIALFGRHRFDCRVVSPSLPENGGGCAARTGPRLARAPGAFLARSVDRYRRLCRTRRVPPRPVARVLWPPGAVVGILIEPSPMSRIAEKTQPQRADSRRDFPDWNPPSVCSCSRAVTHLERRVRVIKGRGGVLHPRHREGPEKDRERESHTKRGREKTWAAARCRRLSSS